MRVAWASASRVAYTFTAHVVPQEIQAGNSIRGWRGLSGSHCHWDIMLKMLLLRGGAGSEHIIDVDKTEVQSMQNLVHELLEGMQMQTNLNNL